MKKLIAYLLLLCIIVIFTLIIIMPAPDENTRYKYTKEEKKIVNVEVGRFYLIEFKNKRDPFDKPFRDTIFIMDKKEGYVKWINKKFINDSTKYWSSSEEDFISTNVIEIRKINPGK
jgi:hypothetical protein